MIAAANVLTDLYLSIAALIGLTILHGTLIKRAADDLLVRRLVFGLRVGMMLFAGRALIVLTGGTAMVLPTISAGVVIGAFFRLTMPIGFFWYCAPMILNLAP